MGKSKDPNVDLSKAEYSVLHRLWKESPLSVREVYDRLETGWAYTTAKTVMDRMVAKELLRRDKVHGVNVYYPLVKRSQGVSQWIRFIADKVLEIDREEALNMFVRQKVYSRAEIEEMQDLLDQGMQKTPDENGSRPKG